MCSKASSARASSTTRLGAGTTPCFIVSTTSFERLGVPLDEQVVRRETGAADAEPGAPDDVLEGVR